MRSKDTPNPAWQVLVVVAVVGGLIASGLLVAGSAAIDARAELGSTLIEPKLVTDKPAEAMQHFRDHFDHQPWLVIGNSRTRFMEDNETFRFGIPGMRPLDHQIVYDFLESQGALPEHLIILTSFRGLTEVARDSWIETSPRGYQYAVDVRSSGERIKMLVGMLHPDYLEDSWRLMTYQWQGYPEGIDRAARDARHTSRLQDELGARYSEQAQLQMADYHVATHKSYHDTFKKDRGLNDARLVLMTDLIARAVADGVNVSLLLPPMHPALAHDLAAYPYFESVAHEVRAAFRELCAVGPAYAMFDYTDPAVVGVPVEQFRDQVHLRPPGVQLVLENVKAKHHDQCASATEPVRDSP